jgi:hypothetical protein
MPLYRMYKAGFDGVNGVVYANIDRDTIEHIDCREQVSLS